MSKSLRAPSFVMANNDVGVWRRTLEKMTDLHGPMEDWDQPAWAAAAAYYPRAYNAQGGTKYRTGEEVAYIMRDGTPVIKDGDWRPDLSAPQQCPNCERDSQFYEDDYICHSCRDALSFSGAAA